MAVDDDHLLEAVVSQALADVEHVLDKMLEVNVQRAGKVHDMMHIAVTDRRQHEPDLGPTARRFGRHGRRAQVVDLERQVVAVLLDRAGRQDRDLPQRDGFVHLGPGQLVEAIDLADGRHGRGLRIRIGRFPSRTIAERRSGIHRRPARA